MYFGIVAFLIFFPSKGSEIVQPLTSIWFVLKFIFRFEKQKSGFQNPSLKSAFLKYWKYLIGRWVDGLWW